MKGMSSCFDVVTSAGFWSICFLGVLELGQKSEMAQTPLCLVVVLWPTWNEVVDVGSETLCPKVPACFYLPLLQ